MPRCSTLLFSSALALLASQASAAAPTISSPVVYQCSPVTSYQVTCDAPPCQVIARPSDNAAETVAVIGTVETQGASTLSWQATPAQGTAITVYITDADGQFGNNSPTTIAVGTGECSGGGSSGGGSSSSSAPASSSSSSASSASESSESASESASSQSASSSASSGSTSSVVTTSAPSSTRSQPQTTTASGTTPSASPSDQGSGASHIAVGELFAGLAAITALLV